MTPIKRKLLYIFRGTLLRLRIKWSENNALTLSIGYNVDRFDSSGKPKWDGERCIRNTFHGKEKIPASTINRVLVNLEANIENAFISFEMQDKIPTKDQMKAILNGEDLGGEKNLFDAYDEFLKEGLDELQWAQATYKKMKTIKKLLTLYDKDLKFSEIDTDRLKSIMAFQTSNSVSGISKNEIDKRKSIIHYKGKYQNETINKNMTNIKWFLTWASEKGYYDISGIENFKQRYKKHKKPIVFLTWEELMKVYNLDLKGHPEKEKTRDMFCFCCFTSLRYSDMQNLKWANVSDSHISIVTRKTSDALIIDLNDFSKSILEKYKKTRGDSESVFQEKSAQKMNIRLKESCRMCGIDTPVMITEMYGSERKDIVVPKYELITTHCGRRTFISNAISMGIPPNVIMKWTGHSDYKAMTPYLEIADEVRKDNMSLFNRLKDRED